MPKNKSETNVTFRLLCPIYAIKAFYEIKIFFIIVQCPRTYISENNTFYRLQYSVTANNRLSIPVHYVTCPKIKMCKDKCRERNPRTTLTKTNV